jgi:drug/metabolite transporter (DMT)-like permease
VIFTPFAQWVILGSRPQRSELSAAAVCLLGATLMSLGGAGFSGPSMGDLLMLLAAILRAVMVALTRRFATWHEVPALTLTALQAWVVTLGALVTLGFSSKGIYTLPSWDMGFWVRMSFLVIFCTIFAFVAQNYAAARMRPSKVALLMASEPVFGALFGALLLQELVGGWGLIGGVLMLAATKFAVFRQKE